MGQDLWTLDQAAAEVGVSPATLHTWHARGYLNYAGKRGKSALVHLEDVFAAEAARKREHRRKRRA